MCIYHRVRCRYCRTAGLRLQNCTTILENIVATVLGGIFPVECYLIFLQMMLHSKIVLGVVVILVISGRSHHWILRPLVY